MGRAGGEGDHGGKKGRGNGEEDMVGGRGREVHVYEGGTW